MISPTTPRRSAIRSIVRASSMYSWVPEAIARVRVDHRHVAVDGVEDLERPLDGVAAHVDEVDEDAVPHHGLHGGAAALGEAFAHGLGNNRL